MEERLNPDLKNSYLRQVKSWRCEVKSLGARIDAAQTKEQLRACTDHLAEMRVRVRLLCDELDIPTNSTETLDELIRLVLKRVNV